MWAWVLRRRSGHQGAWRRVTLGTLFVPAVPATGAGALGIAGDGAVTDEKTRVAVPTALTVVPAVVVRREGDPGDTRFTLGSLSVLITVLHQECPWVTHPAAPFALSPVVPPWTALGG